MLDYFELNPVKLNTLWGKKSSRGFKDIKMNPGSLKKYLLYHAVEAFDGLEWEGGQRYCYEPEFGYEGERV